MFTGLVEDIGTVRRRSGRATASRLVVATGLGPLTVGESISVSGACLTVDRIVGGAQRGFEADMSTETVARTTLGALRTGDRVHLERATQAGARLGGHVVLGHIDGVGLVQRREPVGASVRLAVRAPPQLARYLAPKGSVAVDGVSLTLNSVSDEESGTEFDVMLVPHTLGRTRLGALVAGAHVNLEVDVLARYVARQLELDARPLGSFERGRRRLARDRAAVVPPTSENAPHDLEHHAGTLIRRSGGPPVSRSARERDSRILAKLRACGY